jgi:psiF repeat
MSMRKLIALVVLGLSVSAVPVVYAGTQQENTKSCREQAKAKGLKGDERKAFMKDCADKKAATSAAGKPVSAKQAAQREKMKSCSKDAKAKMLKGDERKKFMSDCLKS